jgi:hypothetical protein
MDYLAGTRDRLNVRLFPIPGFRVLAGEIAGISLAVAALSLMVVAAMLLWGLKGSRARAALALTLFAAVELTISAIVGRATIPSDITYPAEWAQQLGNNPGLYRCIHINPEQQNLALSLGCYELWGSDPGILGRYGQLMTLSQGRSLENASQYISYTNAGRFDGLYRMFRLRWVFYTANGNPLIATCKAPMQQVQLVGSCRMMPERDAMFSHLLDPGFLPEKEVCLEQTPSIMPAGHDVEGTARVLNQDVNTLEIEAQCKEPAILLVTDNYAKGWQVRALEDSSQKLYELLPGNYCLRAIPLAAGKHHLIMEYAPKGWTIGKWVTAVSLLAYIGICGFALRKRS